MIDATIVVITLLGDSLQMVVVRCHFVLVADDEEVVDLGDLSVNSASGVFSPEGIALLFWCTRYHWVKSLALRDKRSAGC